MQRKTCFICTNIRYVNLAIPIYKRFTFAVDILKTPLFSWSIEQRKWVVVMITCFTYVCHESAYDIFWISFGSSSDKCFLLDYQPGIAISIINKVCAQIHIKITCTSLSESPSYLSKFVPVSSFSLSNNCDFLSMQIRQILRVIYNRKVFWTVHLLNPRYAIMALSMFITPE